MREFFRGGQYASRDSSIAHGLLLRPCFHAPDGEARDRQHIPFDLVVAIMIAELGAIPLQSHEIPLGHGLIPIAILAAVEVLVALACLKFPGIRRVVIGEPTVIVEDGRVMGRNMQKLRA